MKYFNGKKNPPIPEPVCKHQHIHQKLYVIRNFIFSFKMQDNGMILCKTRNRTLDFCKCEGDCQNIQNIGGNIKNDDENFEEEKYGNEVEDNMNNLLE